MRNFYDLKNKNKHKLFHCTNGSTTVLMARGAGRTKNAYFLNKRIELDLMYEGKAFHDHNFIFFVGAVIHSALNKIQAAFIIPPSSWLSQKRNMKIHGSVEGSSQVVAG